MISLLLAATTSATAAAIPGGGVLPSPNELEAPHRFRSGVALGFSLGAGLVGASGYPNDSSKIGEQSYYSASGWMLGTAQSLFVMGALSDYISVGFWYAHATAANGDWRSNGNGGGLRVEVFPFAGIQRFAGLGLLGQFGLGGGSLSAKQPGYPEATGTQSFVLAGVFHEWSSGHVLGGHFAIGPSLEYGAIWSQSFERHGLTANARLVFYGGP